MAKEPKSGPPTSRVRQRHHAELHLRPRRVRIAQKLPRFRRLTGPHLQHLQVSDLLAGVRELPFLCRYVGLHHGGLSLNARLPPLSRFENSLAGEIRLRAQDGTMNLSGLP
jgi:hypothetical protein